MLVTEGEPTTEPTPGQSGACQGHIAAKTLDFERTIAITVGLPFIRASVDHGTAFDRAWKGIANPESMLEAIDVTVRMLGARRN